MIFSLVVGLIIYLLIFLTISRKPISKFSVSMCIKGELVLGRETHFFSFLKMYMCVTVCIFVNVILFGS